MACAKLALLLCISSTACFPQGVISGTVIEATSGEPVRKAVVTVTWQGTPRSWATTRTDGSGRFTFEGLPPGKYNLSATKAQLGTANYGAASVRELGDLITLGEGETRADLKLRFVRSSTISGRVLDPDGDPVPGVSVNLLRSGRNLGERIMVNSRSANTNDRGEYKITMVDPGEYYLRCIPNIQRQMGMVPRDVVVPQYYGGGRDSKEARPVLLRGAEVLTGIDFRLVTEHPAKITGRVTGVPHLDPPPEMTPAGGVGVGNQAVRFNRGRGQGVQVQLSPADDNQ
jgi:hypothetical protein